jgi:hypothetical protein
VDLPSLADPELAAARACTGSSAHLDGSSRRAICGIALPAALPAGLGRTRGAASAGSAVGANAVDGRGVSHFVDTTWSDTVAITPTAQPSATHQAICRALGMAAAGRAPTAAAGPPAACASCMATTKSTCRSHRPWTLGVDWALRASANARPAAAKITDGECPLPAGSITKSG